MWGIIPAAGRGRRIQPLAFSKELLPLGSRADGDQERPRAVSEYLVDRMIRAGARRLCFVIAPGKSDILDYFGAQVGPAQVVYVVQPQPEGLCDAIFCALPLIGPEERVLIGLPDTVWFPEDGFLALSAQELSFLLFPVKRPDLFDAVVTDGQGLVQEIQVKRQAPDSHWVWGAFSMTGAVLKRLHDIWVRPERRDEYVGTLVNAYIAEGGRALGVRAGRAYVDVGTVHGYREAMGLLDGWQEGVAPDGPMGEGWSRGELEGRIRELGPWFHNMNLGGVQTAPDHFLGDYPGKKWRAFAHAIPADLRGWSVLDIGCNGGFHAIEMRRRGAERVVGIDSDEGYLAQARFAAEVSGLRDISFIHMSVFDVADLGERFDLVLFLGVLYHLRHPLLALDLIHEHVSRNLLVFQSMQRGSEEVEPLEGDYLFEQTGPFHRPGYPRLHFVEGRYCGDITNWWIPNRACSEAMLRAAGYSILDHPEAEVYVCRHRELSRDFGGPWAVYPAGRKSIDG